MNNQSQWVVLQPQPITLATFTGATVGANGVNITPDYLGVEVTVSGAAQDKTGVSWGSFPQSFVTFQELTGQSSYWYSSGGAADPKKVAKPVAVAWQTSAPPATPTVTVSDTRLSETGETIITVTGTGFDPASSTAIYPPLAGKPGGVYVAFGKFADTWKPSAGAASTARPAATVKWAVLAEDLAAVGGPSDATAELAADGSFSLTLTVSKAAADAAATAKGLTAGNYGIYTYPGGGAATPSFETYAAVTFEPGIPVKVQVPTSSGGGTGPGEFSWTITQNPLVNLGTAQEDATVFNAQGALPTIVVTDTRVTLAPWSLSGQVTDFVAGTDSFGGDRLGWTPTVSANTVGAVAGTAVVPGTGLKTAKTLAAAIQGHAKGSAELSALLNLSIPNDTPAGHYGALLTVTAVG
jgi:hypothetical protein